MKLKTLKDIRKDRMKYFRKKLESFGCPDSYVEQTAKSMVLFLEKQEKEEAIKWVKELEKEEGSILLENDLTTNMPEINLDEGNMIIKNIIYNKEDRNKIAQFLKYLYNLTEEDLK